MPTDAKRQAIAELTELLRSSSALAVADYRGLKVSEMQSVRRTLRAGGVELHVAKNRLLKIAAAEAGRAELAPMLSGPTALASTAGDEIALAKALADCWVAWPSTRPRSSDWRPCRAARCCSAAWPEPWSPRSRGWPASWPET
jgi:large subunit ribosomal protein L10